MHTSALTRWADLLSAIGGLWRLALAIAALLVISLLRHSLANLISRIRRLRIHTGNSRIELDLPDAPSLKADHPQRPNASCKQRHAEYRE